MPKVYSLPVEPVDQVLTWMEDYRKDPKLSRKEGTSDVPVNGFSIDVDDLQKLVAGLDPSKNKVFIGMAMKDGSHTVIVGATEFTTDANGEMDGSVLIHNKDSRPIYEYTKPCPQNCPKTIKEV